jgi:hypothetical protein
VPVVGTPGVREGYRPPGVYRPETLTRISDLSGSH